MKDITELKEKYCRMHARRCFGGDDIAMCPKGDACDCRLAAEIRAYRTTIIPRGFHKFSIFDFDGRADGEIVLDAKTVIKSKNALSNYCWGVPFNTLKVGEAKKAHYSDSISVMDRRRRNGDCVIIFGHSRKKMGRTLIASIIIHEAIKRRFHSTSNALQTYDWIDFSSLKDIATNRDSLNEYQFCDWLVVDNFSRLETRNSPRAQHYISSVIDPFFISRCKSGLPTILVFRFDIEETGIKERMSEMFGFGIEEVINDKSTTLISLLSEERDGQ